MRLAFLVFGLLLLAPAAQAAAPAHWAVDPAGSKLSFQGRMSDQAFNGAFRRWNANIVFDSDPDTLWLRLIKRSETQIANRGRRDVRLPLSS